MYFKEIALASLLHDIGKFYHRAKQSPINNKGTYLEVSKEFIKTYSNFFNKYVDSNVLINIIGKNDEKYFEEEPLENEDNENLKNCSYIINMADSLSFKKQDEKQFEEKDFKLRPLDCVFNRINIENIDGNEILSYKAKKYSENNIMPQNIEKNEFYYSDDLIKNFTNEINIIIEKPPKNFNHLMIVLDNILKKYLWCIPVLSQDKILDVSLYDHLKTSCAISNVLYLYQYNVKKLNYSNINNDNFKYILAGFSFSDAQEYVIGRNNTNQKEISNQIRARSFLVNIIIETICYELLSNLKLPIQNKVFNTGDKCFILLPNIEEYVLKFKEIMKTICIDLYNKYKGDICINYDFIELNKNSFENYGENLVSLIKKINMKKFKPFQEIFIENDNWNLENFVLYNDLENKKICNQCNIRLIENTIDICNECKTYLDIGKILPKAKYVVFKKNTGFPLFLDNTISIVEKIDNTDFDYAIQLDNFEESNSINLPIETKYITKYIPLDEYNNSLTFEDIALKSVGIKKLTIIKINMNNLFYILEKGFKVNVTISRAATFSRMINMFFTNYINYLLKNHFKNSYCMSSGGDDLILVCPFSDATKLTANIILAFKQFVGKNNNFNLSISIVDFYPKANISLLLNECDFHLKFMKNKKDINKIYFMGEYLTEKSFMVLFFNITKKIKNEIDKININILRRISKYSEMYRNFIDKKDVMELMFLPLFDRDIRRNYNELEKTEFYEYIMKITKNVADYRKENKELYYMNTVIKYVLLITKEERKNDI